MNDRVRTFLLVCRPAQIGVSSLLFSSKAPEDMKLTFTAEEKESTWKTNWALLTRTSKIDSSLFKFWPDKKHVPFIGHA